MSEDRRPTLGEEVAASYESRCDAAMLDLALIHDVEGNHCPQARPLDQENSESKRTGAEVEVENDLPS